MGVVNNTDFKSYGKSLEELAEQEEETAKTEE
jgi:hypothetical protein